MFPDFSFFPEPEAPSLIPVMPSAPHPSLTPAQCQAVAARGNVLVMAGAGTGKTKTLVERCLDCLGRERARLDELLIVTFTEAAATEMRLRLRRELEARVAAAPDDDHWRQQLALFEVAHIGTLHGFCFRLVREHFHELGLDPQLAILEEGEAHELAAATLDSLLDQYYEGEDPFSRAVQELIRNQSGRDDKIRALILRVHHYSQTRPEAAGWLATQAAKFTAPESADWPGWFAEALTAWRAEWLPALEALRADNPKAAELAPLLARLPAAFSRAEAAELFATVAAAKINNWPARRKTALLKPLERCFDEAEFLGTLATINDGRDPLAEDWQWVRGHMATLLQLAQRFADRLVTRKKNEGTVDFHDLEQFALQLLWDTAGQPTPVALAWREKLRFVFVDEDQDINAAQDRIIAGLARTGADANRFLVGDVKQSIYRFRLADPEIFRTYARDWPGTLFLSENFRSRAGVLDFVNSLFGLVLHPAVGGVSYTESDRLRFGAPAERAVLAAVPGAPRVELLLRHPAKESAAEDSGGEEPGASAALADLDDATREARVLARRLNELLATGHEIWDEADKKLRPVQAGDIAVLLRSPRGKAEIYAQEFARAGLPLVVARGGFFETAEILDLLSLLQLLDNPLQDIPCLAVLRSPFVGLTLEELARIRLAAPGQYFWTALNRAATTLEPGATREKITRFLARCSRWRKLTRQVVLSECLASILAETFYLEWWRTRPRGGQSVANIEQFVHLTEQFDRRQRGGLTRLLAFLEARRELAAEAGPPPGEAGGAVRLMSIHQSKGLEFPVVALPDLGKGFNEQDLRGEIIFDEAYGLCPQVKPPASGRHYPSLPWWLVQRRQKRELRGEELRLLYVALTRARDSLILLTTLSANKWEEKWTEPVAVTIPKIAEARSYADWLGLWFATQTAGSDVKTASAGNLPALDWRWVDETAPAETPAGPLTAPAAPVEPLADEDLTRLTALLDWQYPHPAATTEKAKTSVTELRRAAQDADLDSEAAPFFPRRSEAAPGRARSAMSAAEQGIAHHKFLQRVALEADLETAAGLAAEADRLAAENVLTPAERTVLDLPALAGFWQSSLGREIRAHASQVRRELPFTVRFTPAEIAVITGLPGHDDLPGEFLIIQGAADLVVLLENELWLIDFKTDHATAAGLAEKVKTYTPQVKLYAAALNRIYHLPVTRTALHFLAARQTVML